MGVVRGAEGADAHWTTHGRFHSAYSVLRDTDATLHVARAATCQASLDPMFIVAALALGRSPIKAGEHFMALDFGCCLFVPAAVSELGIWAVLCAFVSSAGCSALGG